MTSKQHDLNEWQAERSPMRSTVERDELRRGLSVPRILEGIEDNPAARGLRRAIVDRPDDEDPRRFGGGLPVIQCWPVRDPPVGRPGT